MSEYRVVSSPSWQVQLRHGERWVTVYYCKDRKGALRCKRDCEAKATEWASLSKQEQARRILRNGLPAESTEGQSLDAAKETK